ncbi:uncharacterized protein LOC120322949 isoform X2 [Pipra filicauda]|uniref:Uncharacterized protein LOC120322949 isoform X2 n=1 Tax=Pipra filicauda TaxID=649802 RepID=A0A7R5K6S8_9PASS|nr:uncharacterized protein LOC120322949 isoform X2 [Pipra filicauda]
MGCQGATNVGKDKKECFSLIPAGLFPRALFPTWELHVEAPPVQLSKECRTSRCSVGANRGLSAPGFSRRTMEKDRDGGDTSRLFPCHISRDVCLGDCAAEPYWILQEFVSAWHLWDREDGPTLSDGPASPEMILHLHGWSSISITAFHPLRETVGNGKGGGCSQPWIWAHTGCPAPSPLPSYSLSIPRFSHRLSGPNHQEKRLICILREFGASQGCGLVGHLRNDNLVSSSTCLRLGKDVWQRETSLGPSPVCWCYWDSQGKCSRGLLSPLKFQDHHCSHPWPTRPSNQRADRDCCFGDTSKLFWLFQGFSCCRSMIWRLS